MDTTDFTAARTADLLGRLNLGRTFQGKPELKAWKASRAALIEAIHSTEAELQASIAVKAEPPKAKAPKAKAKKPAARAQRRRWEQTAGLDRNAAKVLRAKLRKAAAAKA